MGPGLDYRSKIVIKEKEFIRRISGDCRIRHRHIRFKTKITQFSVQLEVFSKDKWSPVVRYDTAHGIAHRDLIHYSGEVSKTPILCLNYNDALVFAESDLISNWENYRKMFIDEVNKNE